MTYHFPHALLIQFAKVPELGKVKTRMQPYLSAEQSLLLHCTLVSETYKTLIQSQLAPVEIWTSGSQSSTFFKDLAPSPILCEQKGADLGMRMHHALSDGLRRYKAVVLIGSDCPFMTEGILRQAMGALSSGSDCILGPATDGGYVLIGLTEPSVQLFENVAWGSDKVLEQTKAHLRQLNWNWRELEPLADIDRPEDLNQIRLLKEYEDLILTY